MHSSSLVESPEHVVPPPLGSGLVQVRVSVRFPSVQVPSTQSDHPPLITGINMGEYIIKYGLKVSKIYVYSMKFVT